MAEKKISLFKSRAWITWMFVFGVILLGMGFIGLLMEPAAPGSPAVPFISFGFILTLLSGLRLWKDGDQSLQDERTRKIGAYGLSWSWLLTFLIIFGIFWADYLHLFSPDLQTLTVSLILLMGISAKAFQEYLFRKGDVE